MKLILAFAFSLLFSLGCRASGPLAPAGWSGSFEPRLPNGNLCCLPADLNGTKLVGGAFVHISTDGRDFALFALTYTGPRTSPKEKWQLLERHPISMLTNYCFSLEPPGRYPFGAIVACTKIRKCSWYAAEARQRLLFRVRRTGR